jgi:hypothetical protein
MKIIASFLGDIAVVCRTGALNSSHACVQKGLASVVECKLLKSGQKTKVSRGWTLLCFLSGMQPYACQVS